MTRAHRVKVDVTRVFSSLQKGRKLLERIVTEKQRGFKADCHVSKVETGSSSTKKPRDCQRFSHTHTHQVTSAVFYIQTQFALPLEV